MALDFNGTADDVSFGTQTWLNALATLSISLWVQMGTLATNRAFISRSSGSARNLSIQSDTSADSAVYFEVGDGLRGVTDTGRLSAGEWHHLAMVFDGGETGNANRLKAWVDGAAETLTFTGTIGTTLPSLAQPLLLAELTRTPTNSDVNLAHLKMWNTALTAAQIVQERWLFRPSTTAGLQLWAPMSDAGATALDYSGNGRDGTVTGAASISGPALAPAAPVLVL